MFLTDAQFKLTFVNSAFQSTTGYAIEETLGRTIDFLRAPSECPKTDEYLACVAQGRDWRGELLNVRSDGTTYPVEAAISPIYDKNGNLLGYAAFERDLTMKRRLQDELLRERDFARSIIDSLDSAVYTVGRDFCLTHINDGWRKLPAQHGWLTLSAPPVAGQPLLELVTDAEKRAQLQEVFTSVLADGRPRESIGALAAGVAHDFNNLLQAIRGNVSLLLMDEKLGATHRTRLQKVEQAAVRAAGITQQLLSFSRPSEDADTVVDFNQVISEAGQLARRSLAGGITFQLQPAPTEIKVRLDATRAQQVLLNLCVNAQDAMPNGGTLTIANALVPLTLAQATKLHQPPGTVFAQCRVSDTGTGIPPEVRARIFDPFFTTKGHGKGTGLGLSIVHSIVAQAGGLLEVDSVVGQGTTFSLHLPVVQCGITAKVLAAPHKAARGSGRVLVVDDLDLILDFTRTFVKAVGYDVLVASSAEEALELLGKQATPVDLLFTDYNMSGKNGRQLIQEVAERWPGTKFILTSGYLEYDERVQIEAEGRVRVLPKPFNLQEATDLLAELLPVKV